MAGINGAKPGGKGAFTYGGGKRMSGKEFPMGSGKMSSSHGCTGQSKNNNMDKNTGGYRIGSDCRTFHKNPSMEQTKGCSEGHVTAKGVHKD